MPGNAEKIAPVAVGHEQAATIPPPSASRAPRRKRRARLPWFHGSFPQATGPVGPAWRHFLGIFVVIAHPDRSFRLRTTAAAAAQGGMRGTRGTLFRTFSAALPPPRDPNGLRNVQHCSLCFVHLLPELASNAQDERCLNDRSPTRSRRPSVPARRKNISNVEAGHRPVPDVRRRLFRRTDRAVRRRARTADQDHRAARARRRLSANRARRNEHASSPPSSRRRPP